MEVFDIISIENAKIYTSVVFIILIAIIFRAPTAIADSDTIVSINPSNQIVTYEETFSVEVYCIPGQPIKSYELELSFDPLLLEANSISEGDIFNGYPTFFNSGTIDNTAGVIDNVYNLIISSDDVSNPGTLVTISFTSKMTNGASGLNLLNVGITNETGYIPSTVNDGNVEIQGTNNNPNRPSKPSGSTSREIGQSGSYSTSATDPDGDQVQYRFDWDADGSHDYSSWTNLGASGDTDSFSHSWSSPGTYIIKSLARDEHGATSSSWSTGLRITVTASNNPPSTPRTPSGPTTRETGESGSYSTSATNPDGNQVQYRFDWDADGSHDYSSWTNLGASGHTNSLSHSWEDAGTYVVKAQARDENGQKSAWSNGLSVFISSIPINGFIFSNIYPSIGSTNVRITTSSLSINIKNLEGNAFNYKITTNPDVGSRSENGASNGIKSCSISGLDYSTKYTWCVSCSDTVSGTWANQSYFFTTESSFSPSPSISPPDDDGGGSHSSGGGGSNDASEQSNTPETPVKPSGPTFIELDVEYFYSISTFDVDGDKIRYRFDWGDGNYSNWSDFMFSNKTVSMSHIWNVSSNYSVRVIAQDENSMNSSWSPVLNVTASQADSGEILPVADVNVSSNVSVNQTIVFNAVDSFDPDGFIVSYKWDFGDGETGSGVSPEHVYRKSGRYNVTLMLTDNDGNTLSEKLTVNVASVVLDKQLEEKRDLLLFQFGVITIWSIVAIICFFVVFLLKSLFFPNLHVYIPLSIYGIWEPESKIVETKTSENEHPKWIVSNKMTDDVDFKRESVLKRGDYHDKWKLHVESNNVFDEPIESVRRQVDEISVPRRRE